MERRSSKVPALIGMESHRRWILLFAFVSQSALGAERVVDWPRIFGPTGDAKIADQPMLLPQPGEAWRVEWKLALGEGYAGPAIKDGKILLYHRVRDEEVLECLDMETRQPIWKHSTPTEYMDQYGYNNGPRATPVIDGNTVYALGAEGKLHSIEFSTGAVQWSRWLNRDYRVPQDFFGVAGSPLVVGNQIILNVGGQGTGVVGLSREEGKLIWSCTDDGPSYASPVHATIHGRAMAFAFTKAGLVAVDIDAGKHLWSIPFRSKLYESVNASTPLVVGDLVFVSATYGTGSLCVKVLPDGTYEEQWRSPRAMDSHFSNLIEVGGTVYGFAGRHESDCELRAIDLATGRVYWSVPSILGRGSMMLVGDQFFLWGERGHLLVRTLSREEAPQLPDDPRDERSLMSYPCWTPPAWSAGRIFLRNERQIIAVDVRPAK